MQKRAASAALGTLTNRKLLAILLDARGAQAGEPVLIDRILPGEKLFDREGPSLASLHDRRLSYGVGRELFATPGSRPKLALARQAV